MAKRKPSTYAHIVPGLPELPVEADKQQTLDIFKESIRKQLGELTPQNLLKHYTALRRRQDELKDEISTVYLALEAATQLIVDSNKRQEDGWGTYGAAPNTLIAANGDRIRVDVEPYASLVDKDANRQWAVAEGLERMLMLPWSTINSITKKRLLAGQPEPPGVKTFKKQTIVYTEFKAAQAQDQEPVAEEWSPDAELETADKPF